MLVPVPRPPSAAPLKVPTTLAFAVASAPVVAEYLVPLLRADGRALLYRGQWTQADGEELERALGPLRARVSTTTT